MHTIETHTTIQQLLKVYHKCGLWPSETESKFRKMKNWSFLFYFALYLTSLVAETIRSDDWSESMFSVVVIIACGVITIKLSYILWKKEEINELLQATCFHSFPRNENSEEKSAKIEMRLNNFMKFAKIFIISISLEAVFLNALPVLTIETKLPLNLWIPFDWKTNKFGYWSAYLFITSEICFAAIVSFFAVIVWYLMLNCSLKYEVLGMQFRQIGGAGTRKAEVEKWEISKIEQSRMEIKKQKYEQKLRLNELIVLMKMHRKIQETINGFESCFATLFFVQIATSSIAICCTLYVLEFTSDGNFIQSAIYAATLVYNLFDIFMIMYFGNEIKLSSGRLSHCLFESDWIDQTQLYKKCMIIFSEMLRQPHVLVIGKLYPLDLETFTSILNFAWGLFKILQDLH